MRSANRSSVLFDLVIDLVEELVQGDEVGTADASVVQRKLTTLGSGRHGIL